MAGKGLRWQWRGMWKENKEGNERTWGTSRIQLMLIYHLFKVSFSGLLANIAF
jgi:hypothetical protein